ncbi:hypothetical protein Z517_06000 [Fonsecaea pedrosoi CBS 271.37]|uniref:Transcription factor domain-containing protein n=1 Tax=Fonsecaea pedrosoi CBS 271.37 TaxID=1442368 RepID=A0A0D2GF12_9EURO|nr:uncharacterized protein Z517_06000 [Fonsecaea pedrosoi CBS 271.37]KIW79388.1 hypothetical protein Z517_06000 [Fonsecaea pedrosoi CBS 271.37]
MRVRVHLCILFMNETHKARYLFSLQQKVQALQLEIQQTADQESASESSEFEAVPLSMQGYHLEVAACDELPSPTRIAYLGPGTSARLIQSFLKSTGRGQMTDNLHLGRHLFPNSPFHSTNLDEPRSMTSFLTNIDLRKVELHSLVPPSTQRAIIENYFRTVATEYALLPIEHESDLSTYENPLKWAGSNKDDPMACSLTIIFAISSALITRDVDPILSNISSRFREDVEKLALCNGGCRVSSNTLRWACTALCALSMIELISPSSGQLWDLLGRAASTMEDLQAAGPLGQPNLDPDLERLERVLLKLESLASLHFGRPSLFLQTYLRPSADHVSPLHALSNELGVESSLHRIHRTLATVPVPSERYLEALIPQFLQVASAGSEISLSSARLYLALSPLFIDSDRFGNGVGMNAPSPRMVHLITESASVLIDHYTRLNQTTSIISIWMTAEHVLIAGVIWAAGLVHQHRLSGPRLQTISATGPGPALGPIVKVSSLLASFSARWKAGSAFVNAWETVVETLWQVL